MKVLLVEDDRLIGDGTRRGLLHQGFSVDWAERREDALLAIQANSYDLIVLDIGLPDGSGLDVLSHLRKESILTPVLLLTARNATPDRVRGLDLGADDYLVKPFALDELCARLRALRRRLHGAAAPTLVVQGITLDPADHTVKRDRELVDLGPKEFSILQALFERAGRVVAKSTLEESLYGWGEETSSNAVEVLVHRIRKKLGPEVIRTVRGIGYITEKDGAASA